MDYKNKNDKTYAEFDGKMAKCGGRLDGDGNYSVMEGRAKAGLDGLAVKASAEGHAFQVGARDGLPKVGQVNARFFGLQVGAEAGLDPDSLVTEDKKVLGVKVTAKATMAEADVGPFRLHLGAGVSTGAEVKDGTLDASLGGNGVLVGRRLGVKVFDNEFSVDSLALVGKGWLW